ncbi:MAG: hypothetical protein IPJ84_01695 [Bdellovibrionales bacterium]|nr:hypothetical protein [Bdellovibrionales bacterium]
MAIGLAHVKSRKIEKTPPAEVIAAIPPLAPDKVSTKKLKALVVAARAPPTLKSPNRLGWTGAPTE